MQWVLHYIFTLRISLGSPGWYFVFVVFYWVSEYVFRFSSMLSGSPVYKWFQNHLIQLAFNRILQYTIKFSQIAWQLSEFHWVLLQDITVFFRTSPGSQVYHWVIKFPRMSVGFPVFHLGSSAFHSYPVFLLGSPVYHPLHIIGLSCSAFGSPSLGLHGFYCVLQYILMFSTISLGFWAYY